MGLRFKSAGGSAHSFSAELPTCGIYIRTLLRANLRFKAGCREDCAEAQYVLGFRLLIASVHGVEGYEVYEHMYSFEESHQQTRMFYCIVDSSEKGILYCYSVSRCTLVLLHCLAELGQWICLVYRHQHTAKLVIRGVERDSKPEPEAGLCKGLYSRYDAGCRYCYVPYAEISLLRGVEHTDRFQNGVRV